MRQKISRLFVKTKSKEENFNKIVSSVVNFSKSVYLLLCDMNPTSACLPLEFNKDLPSKVQKGGPNTKECQLSSLFTLILTHES